MNQDNNTRRSFLKFNAVAVSAMLFNACSRAQQSTAANENTNATDVKKNKSAKGDEIEVTASAKTTTKRSWKKRSSFLPKQKGGEVASYADVLAAQHSRGRGITDYILSIT